MLRKPVSDLWLLSGTETCVFYRTLSVYFLRGLNKKHMEVSGQSAEIHHLRLSVLMTDTVDFLHIIYGIINFFIYFVNAVSDML